MLGIKKNPTDVMLKKVQDELREVRADFIAVEENLQEDIRSLKIQRSDLKDQVEAKIREAARIDLETKHAVKMKHETMELEFQKKEMEVKADAETRVAGAKDQYRDKLEKNLEQQKVDILKMYEQILARLPDVNARLKISSKD